MDKISIIYVILACIILYNAVVLLKIKSVSKKVRQRENKIIDLFYSKVNKIPPLVELMRNSTKHEDIFEDIIYLHKLGIIYNVRSIYDILEINDKIHKEFQFLMKLSAKIPNLHRQ